MRTIAIGLMMSIGLASGAELSIDTSALEKIPGAQGAWSADHKIYTLRIPRQDVKVIVDGAALPPGSLAAIASLARGSRNRATLDGEFVLFADVVNPALTIAFENGLDILAVHHRFFFDEPRVYILRVSAELPVEKLSDGVRRMVNRVAQIRAERAQPLTSFGGVAVPGTNTINVTGLEDALALKAQTTTPAIIFSFTRAGASGSATFSGSETSAVVRGSFVVSESQLQMVIRALRHCDANIVAVHPLSGRKPAFEVQYHAKARPPRLALAVRTALETLTSKSP